MIVGRGMLAQTFSSFETKSDIIIFASGVSDSSAKEQTGFDRERGLLDAQPCGKEHTLVYFSTVSIFDPDLQNSLYVLHKRNLEDFIRQRFESYRIYRLPNLVGRSGNVNTLTNYVYHKIMLGEELVVYKNAFRYIMDVDDVFLCVNQLLKVLPENGTINVRFDNLISVPSLVGLMEVSLGKEANKIFVEKGSRYEPENKLFSEVILSKGFSPGEDYNKNVISKYYPRILS